MMAETHLTPLKSPNKKNELIAILPDSLNVENRNLNK